MATNVAPTESVHLSVLYRPNVIGLYTKIVIADAVDVDAGTACSGTCMSLYCCCMFQSSEDEQKKEILDWIEAVIGEKISKDPFEKVLKDGVILCK